MEYQVQDSRPTSRRPGEKLWNDCQAHKLNKEDVVDRCRWAKLKRMSGDQDGYEWVNVSSGTGPPG